jgi:hypothetical protein
MRAYELGANSYAVKPSTLQGYTRFATALSVWWLEQNRTLDHAARSLNLEPDY